MIKLVNTKENVLKKLYIVYNSKTNDTKLHCCTLLYNSLYRAPELTTST